MRLIDICKVFSILVLLVRAASASESETVVIVAFGDSLVHGFGLYHEDGFVPVLESGLTARGHDVRVVNAGVSGDTSAGGLARLDWAITPETDGVIVLFGGNDLLRGIFPDETRRNLDGMLDALDHRRLPVLLIGHEAPENYGLEYKLEFETIYGELSHRYETVFYPRFFAAIEDGLSRYDARIRYLQDDLLHPNSDGVALIVEDLIPYMEQLLGRIEGTAVPAR